MVTPVVKMQPHPRGRRRPKIDQNWAFFENNNQGRTCLLTKKALAEKFFFFFEFKFWQNSI